MKAESWVQGAAWTAGDLGELLQARREVARPHLANPYIQAAAVLSGYSPKDIRPIKPLPKADRPAAFQELIEKSSVVSLGRDKERTWSLSDEVRQRVLRAMGSVTALRAALKANPSRIADTRQQFIEKLIKGESMDPVGMSLADLRLLCQVSGWLRGIEGITVPTDAVLRYRLSRAELLQPFHHLVGSHFRGRRPELDTLRAYVGVVAPDSALTRIASHTTAALKAIFDLVEEPPLFIHGSGGAGKSTLLAKFILEHAEAAEAFQFPFVYLDFDRPGLMADDPTVLLIEMVAQLDAQFPDRGLDELHAEWNQLFIQDSELGEHSEQERIFETRVAGSYQRRKQWIDQLVKRFSFVPQNKPFLLVLDTFEEVQYRSSGYVVGLWDLLVDMQKALPRMRVVLAGRAPAQGHPSKSLELGDFDRDAALGFLDHFGVSQADAELLHKHFGGNPLTLKLAAEALRREKVSAHSLTAIRTRGRIYGQIDAAIVQGQLYDRILAHVKDERVKQLAHPGLVLRRITPDLIREVLAEPCEVEVRTAEDASDLFELFSREYSLVTFDSGALRHIPYIRKIMLPLVYSQASEAVSLIHDNAVAFYENSTEPAARAEELYHRLARGDSPETVDARWQEDAGLKLAGVIDELPPAGQAYLAARLGRELDPRIRKAADQQTWEGDAERRARQLIKIGRLADALAVLNERPSWSAGSRLYVLAASIHAQATRVDEALALVDRGLASSDDTTSAGTILDLSLLGARLKEATGDLEAAAAGYDDVIVQAERRRDARLIWEVGLARLGLHHMGVPVAVDISALRELMVRTWREMPIGRQARFSGLLRLMAGEVVREHPDVCVKVLRGGGLGSTTAFQRQLFAELLSIDSTHRVAPGLLKDVITSPEAFSRFVESLLSSPDVAPPVLRAIAAALRAAGLDGLRPGDLPPRWPGDAELRILPGRSARQLKKFGRRIHPGRHSRAGDDIDHGEMLVAIASDSSDEETEARTAPRVAPKLYAIWAADMHSVVAGEQSAMRARLYPQCGADAAVPRLLSQRQLLE